MANGQFIIPNNPPQEQYEAQRAAVFSAYLDTKQYTPEVEARPKYPIKEIEKRLHSYRETAMEIEESKRPWLRSLKSLILTPKPMLAELIEKESIIGGKLLHKYDPEHEYRFWEEGGEWFFGYSDGKHIDMVDSTIHYQATDDYIQKSYRGHVVPFAQGEKENFILTAQAFEEAVVHEMYPFDEALIELTNADLLEPDAKKDDFTLAA